jgi:hypothetical protein
MLISCRGDPFFLTWVFEMTENAEFIIGAPASLLPLFPVFWSIFQKSQLEPHLDCAPAELDRKVIGYASAGVSRPVSADQSIEVGNPAFAH